MGQVSQHDLKKEDIVYFLHIPKTAGTTFTNIIDDWFSLNEICPERGWPELLAKFPKDLSKYRLFRGHFGYGLHRVLDKKPLIITMLREPISLLFSAHDQMVRDNVVSQKKSEIISLHQSINDPQYTPNFTNIQSRWLGLDIDMISSFSSKNINDENALDQNIRFTNHNLSDSELLDNAKKNLLECIFFGLTEKFEESLFLLCYVFGFRPRRHIISRNISQKKDTTNEINDETNNKIQSITSVDRQLYEFAKQIFDKRYNTMVDELKKRYYESQFDSLPSREMIIELLERHYEERIALNHIKNKHIEYDFTQAISGSGWQPREFFPYNGRAYRWTGPTTQATIDFSLDNSLSYEIKFSTVLKIKPDTYNGLSLKANNKTVKIYPVHRDVDYCIFSGIIEREMIEDSKFIRLAFEVKETARPGTHDDRMLGVAIDWIRIIPLSQIDKRYHFQDN